jgi:hypothetical protein
LAGIIYIAPKYRIVAFFKVKMVHTFLVAAVKTPDKASNFDTDFAIKNKHARMDFKRFVYTFPIIPVYPPWRTAI